MKSRITIDLDYDNQPVIKIEYCPSEDVRDKMVAKFLETFGATSWLCSFIPFDTDIKSNGDKLKTSLLRPIKPHELHGTASGIKNVINAETKN